MAGMKIQFTQIPARLNYPRNIKGDLSTIHSSMVTYVQRSFVDTNKYKRQVIKGMNILSYMKIRGDSFPVGWNIEAPFEGLDISVDEDELKTFLSPYDLYLEANKIQWDLVESTDPVTAAAVQTKRPTSSSVSTSPAASVSHPTDKSDLYIMPPTIPRFDVNQPYLSENIDGTQYVIYPSLPSIPTKQNEISVTTDISKITSVDLLKLFPNRLIQTRAPALYQQVPSLSFDAKLGCILPISGFTEEQVRDNIVRYPHLFRLSKCRDDEVIGFYSTIEISGELFRISSVWKDLPESNSIPFQSDFVKEYVVRRYLLERDIKRVEHRYPMYGELDPFLTLFTTPEDYAEFGYADSIELAKQCVLSRVSYKQSRNPILRRLQDV